MKKCLILLISIFTVAISFAQTASDYYLPLCVGNYLKFYSPDNASGWSARTTYNSIIREEPINGEKYYVQKGFEIPENNPTDTNVFHYFWLRKDVNGEIIIGAMDPTYTGILDSAIIFPPGSVFFPNQFLTLGYTQSYTIGDITYTDSIISISATAGIYNNCIQKRQIQKQNSTIIYMEDIYYAYDIGAVMEERFIPPDQAHLASIIDFLAIDCYSMGVSNIYSEEREFKIVPNPAKDIVRFNIVNMNSDYFALNIYDVAGSLVKSEILLQNQVRISDLNNGIYVVEIKSNNWSGRQKLIINR